MIENLKLGDVVSYHHSYTCSAGVGVIRKVIYYLDEDNKEQVCYSIDNNTEDIIGYTECEDDSYCFVIDKKVGEL